MVRQSRFVIMRMYNNFHLTFSKNQNIIKNERVANERKSSFCCSFFRLIEMCKRISCQKFHKYAIKKCVAYQRKASLCEISSHFFYAEKGGFSLKWQKATR